MSSFSFTFWQLVRERGGDGRYAAKKYITIYDGLIEIHSYASSGS